MSPLRPLLGRVRRAVARRLGGAAARARAPISPHTVDFNDQAIASDPFPHYETLRRAGSVHFLPRHDAWVVLDYDDVQSAFAQPNVFSNAAYAEVDRVLLAADPPEHTAMRKVVSRLFTPDAIDALDTFAAGAAEGALSGRIDVVTQYGKWLSEAVTAQLLGFAPAMLDHVRTAILLVQDQHSLVALLQEVSTNATLFARLCEGGVEANAARSLTTLMWLAGTTTTQRVIAEAVLGLLLRPDVRQTLAHDHSQIAPFLEEILRLEPAELMVPRLTTAPVRLGGADIPADAAVYLCVAAANRDPAKFDDPATLRLGRLAPRHMTFGFGVHHCVGSLLAKRVIATSIRTLLVRAPEFRAATALDSLPRTTRMTVHTLDRLLIYTQHA